LFSKRHPQATTQYYALIHRLDLYTCVQSPVAFPGRQEKSCKLIGKHVLPSMRTLSLGQIVVAEELGSTSHYEILRMSATAATVGQWGWWCGYADWGKRWNGWWWRMCRPRDLAIEPHLSHILCTITCRYRV